MYLPFFFLLSTSRSANTMGLPLESQHSHLIPSPLLVVSQKHETFFPFLPILAIYFHLLRARGIIATVVEGISLIPLFPITRQTQSVPAKTPPPAALLVLQVQLITLTFFVLLVLAIHCSPRTISRICAVAGVCE